MTLSRTGAGAVPPAARPSLPWLWMALAGALLTASYLPTIEALVRDWMYDDNVSHGFLVPMVAGYVAWQKRDALRSAAWRRNWLGLALIVYAAAQLYAATLGVELFLARTALVLSVAGIVLFLGGFGVLRILGFPIFLLFFMIPLPAVIYNQITFPLQLLASDLAERALSVCGIPVLRQGNILELPSQSLSVVEACSGIRSLLSLSFLSLVYGHFFESRTWVRAVLFFATAPIAVAANAGRVTLSGLLSEVDTELASGFYHFAEGWAVFMVALVLLVLTHQAIRLGFLPAANEAREIE